MAGHPDIEHVVELLTKEAQPLMKQVSQLFDQWETALRPFLQELEPLFDRLAGLAELAAPYLQKFARYHQIVEKFEATGWLPYHLAPVDYVESYEGNVIQLEQKISEYYVTQWPSIRADIEVRLGNYHIDDEARDTFREALSAHEHKNYRCVSRVLFPEIERTIRLNLFNDTSPVQTQMMLERLIGDRPLECFASQRAFGLVLFGRLVQHLYERVDDDHRDQFAQDFVPNRHAAIHGLVSYSTHKHSMNMIIMADYIFQIIPSLPVADVVSIPAGSPDASEIERGETPLPSLQRGADLFCDLVRRANEGSAMGISYIGFVEYLDSKPFFESRGRQWARADVSEALELAKRVTASAGGRQTVSWAGVQIQAGMDTFLWREDPPHDRPSAAWDHDLPYSREDWLKVFPHGHRRLLRRPD